MKARSAAISIKIFAFDLWSYKADETPLSHGLGDGVGDAFVDEEFKLYAFCIIIRCSRLLAVLEFAKDG